MPDASYLPENYVLDNPDGVTVNVYADDTADLYEVIFTATYVAPEPKTASITVKLVDRANPDNVFYTDTQDYIEGVYPFVPDASYLPENYVLDNPDGVTVSVYADGTADLYEVVFTATYVAPEPKTASITIKLVDSANPDNVFYTDTQDYTEGVYPFVPDASYLPENYVLDNPDGISVTVYADGTADTYEVVFTATYVEPQPDAPKTASITVKIVDSENEGNVFFSETKEYPEGTYTFAPDPSYLWENYQLDSTESVTITVYPDGTADYNVIAFTATYHAPQQPEVPQEPKTASITVELVDSWNADSVFFSETKDYSEGAHTFAPKAEWLPEDYKLDNETPVNVTVYADGTADQYKVTFTASYYESQPEQPDQPDQPENTLPEGVTLIEELNAEGETTKGKLRFRSTPSTANDKNIVFEGVSKGEIVQVTRSVQNEKGELWYGIIYKDTACYVRGDCLQLVQPKPATAKVTFVYQTADGGNLMDPVEQTFEEGSYPAADYQAVMEGYRFVGASAESFVISADGANPDTIVFTYEAIPQEPVTADFTLSYVSEGQPIIDPVPLTLGVGSYAVSDYVREFEGYTYTGSNQETMVVYEDGASSLANVEFFYNRNPVTANVTIRHKLEDGTDVPGLSSETKTLDKNTYDVQSFIRYAEGYSFLHASAESIVVDENGANPAEVTLTYKKDVIQAQVTVQILDVDGNTIPGYETAQITLGEGTHAVSEVQPADPDGYTYSHASAETIAITSGGADPETIAFYYQRKPMEAQVTFSFADEEGNAIAGLESYNVTLGEGVYDTADYAASAPGGYQYSKASAAQIIVDENGARPAEVYFYYAKLPDSVIIPIYHLNADGEKLLEPTALTFSADDFGKTINVSDVLTITPPEGYVVASLSSETITIDQRGGVTPDSIQVTYIVRPIAEADVTFRYQANGKDIADPQTKRLAEGAWDTNEYAIRVDGYELVSASAPAVTVGQDGVASPAEVIFTYEKLATTANLYVHYRNSFGEELPGSPEIRPLERGTHTITPNAAYAPANHVLSANTPSYTVTVDNNLILSTPSVSFNYYASDLKAAVTVNYYDTESAAVFATETLQLAPGTHTLEPNTALVASKGNYEKSDYLSNTVVTVDERGSAAPNTIVFYYQPAAYAGYQGYLLVTEQTAIRRTAAAAGEILSLLNKETVLWSGFQYQSGATEWYDAQTQTGESYRGWVDGAHVKKISAEEAQIRIEEANQPEEPEQNPGYYITIMNNVPLRKYMDTASQAKYLNINTVVQVSGQEYDADGSYLWHASTYYDYQNKVKYSGYIRDGQLRKMTQEEVDEYLSANDPVTPDTPVDPYDPNGPSSYGYVTKDQVNFRSEPGGTRIKMLNKYGMALITGTRVVDGVTWYNVNYAGQVGWIHGDYFHQMTLSEFTSFMGSEAYYQGITNNTSTSTGTITTKPNTGNTGSATQGNVSSVEDWNVGAWQNTGVNTQTSYQPFNPYATPVPTATPKGDYVTATNDVKFHQMANDTSGSVTLPKGAEVTIAGTIVANGKTWYQVTYDGKNGYVDASTVLDKLTAAPTATPTSTFAIGTMIPITYDDQSTETQSGTVPWGVIGGAIALVGGAGVAYAYALNQNKKRKAAAQAAANRRAQAAKAAAAGTASPYARRAVAAAPVSQQPGTPAPQQRPAAPQQPVNTMPQQTAGTYARPQQPVSPAQPQQTANPYSRPAQPAPIINPYAGATAESKSTAAQPTANPYARPIAPVGQQASENASETAAPRRTRMQRYHDAGGDSGASTDA